MNGKKPSPSETFPEIRVKSFTGGKVTLSEVSDEYDWKLIIAYRGKHCPLCTRYLNALNELLPKLRSLGIDAIVVSGDSLEQVREHASEFTLDAPIAYELSLEQMIALGLYISEPRSPSETDHPFNEPGLFVVNKKGELIVVDISNTPFTRPELSTLVNGLQFIKNPDNNYPTRGTYQTGTKNV